MKVIFSGVFLNRFKCVVRQSVHGGFLELCVITETRRKCPALCRKCFSTAVLKVQIKKRLRKRKKTTYCSLLSKTLSLPPVVYICLQGGRLVFKMLLKLLLLLLEIITNENVSNSILFPTPPQPNTIPERKLF